MGVKLFWRGLVASAIATGCAVARWSWLRSRRVEILLPTWHQICLNIQAGYLVGHLNSHSPDAHRET